MIEPQGRAGIGHQRGEFGDIGLDIVEREIDPLGKAALIGFTGAVKRHRPGFRIRHQRPDIAVKGGAGGAQRDIADELFPDQLCDVIKGAGGEAGLLP